MMVYKSCLMSRHSVTLWKRCGEVVCFNRIIQVVASMMKKQTTSISMHDENHYIYMFMVQTILYLWSFKKIPVYENFMIVCNYIYQYINLDRCPKNFLVILSVTSFRLVGHEMTNERWCCSLLFKQFLSFICLFTLLSWPCTGWGFSPSRHGPHYLFTV